MASIGIELFRSEGKFLYDNYAKEIMKELI